MQQFTVLGLGGNLGDRLARFIESIKLLTGRKILTDIRSSEVFESEALLLPGSPAARNIPFYNIAVSGQTRLSPRELLTSIKKIEAELGRSQRERWAPREIDIDILTYGEKVTAEPDLTIPHPGLTERPFALWPLAALCPDMPVTLANEDSEYSAEATARRWGYVRHEIPCRTWRADNRAQSLWRSALQDLQIRLVSGPFAPTELMGILNVTPDSFSDGGQFLSPESALQRAIALYEAGASIIDLGAESTRPQAAPLTPNEEWHRLEPALTTIRSYFAAKSLRPLLSVDTRHATVARCALEAGADWLNDVTGFTDQAMVQTAQQTLCDIVVMHSLGIPPNKDRTLTKSRSAVSQLLEWGDATVARLEAAGIERSRIILDPGIGFGKTAEQSAEIISSASALQALGVRILIGHSRKSFLSLWTSRPAAERDTETALLSAQLAHAGVQYLRVHDVAANVQAINQLGPSPSSGQRVKARRH